jgi:hypothetical protein
MNTALILAYLYGAKLVTEAARKYGQNLDQQTLNRFLKSQQKNEIRHDGKRKIGKRHLSQQYRVLQQQQFKLKFFNSSGVWIQFPMQSLWINNYVVSHGYSSLWCL